MSDYDRVYRLQQQFTEHRGVNTIDEIWSLEHPPIYTLGLAGRTEHILNTGTIPVFKIDRGGQITYHGPGQLVIYLMLDIQRLKVSIKKYVRTLEQAVIEMLEYLNIVGARRTKMPGVYVSERKIASLGIRMRKGCCYHGLSVNVNMDLSPFKGINPCGIAGLEVTQLSEIGVNLTTKAVNFILVPIILRLLGYEEMESSYIGDSSDTTGLKCEAG